MWQCSAVLNKYRQALGDKGPCRLARSSACIQTTVPPALFHEFIASGQRTSYLSLYSQGHFNLKSICHIFEYHRYISMTLSSIISPGHTHLIYCSLTANLPCRRNAKQVNFPLTVSTFITYHFCHFFLFPNTEIPFSTQEPWNIWKLTFYLLNHSGNCLKHL